jgi:hypothetical protein
MQKTILNRFLPESSERKKIAASSALKISFIILSAELIHWSGHEVSE